MNILDIILLVCFIPAIVNGLRKGLVAQVVAIISIVLGVWLSFRFSGAFAGWVSQWTGAVSPDILRIAAFILIMVAVIFGLYALGKVLEASIRIIMLGWLNRLLGLIFALIKCAIIIGLLTVLFDTFNSTFGIVSGKTLSQSMLYGYFNDLGQTVFPYLKGLLSK